MPLSSSHHDRICGYCNKHKPDATYKPYNGPESVCGHTKFPICWTCEKEERHRADSLKAA